MSNKKNNINLKKVYLVSTHDREEREEFGHLGGEMKIQKLFRKTNKIFKTIRISDGEKYTY